MDVSIIIVNWNTRELLRKCVASVFAETKGLSFEVVVVDNASTDGSVEMVRDHFPHVAVIANGENRGFGAANNQGIRRARGRYALLLNSDTRVLDSAIQKTVAFADNYPDAGAVGCRVLGADKVLNQSCMKYPSLLGVAMNVVGLDRRFPFHGLFNGARLGSWEYDTVRDVPVLSGCFMLLRTAAVRQVGGFDERYFMFCEEVDLCRRLTAAHWRILFFPRAEILHLYGASCGQTPDRMLLQRRRSLLLFLADNEGAGTAWLANLMHLIGTLVRLPVWVVAALLDRKPNTNRPTSVRSIMDVLLFHARGLVWPHWGQGARPRKIGMREGWCS